MSRMFTMNAVRESGYRDEQEPVVVTFHRITKDTVGVWIFPEDMNGEAIKISLDLPELRDQLSTFEWGV